jgi:hypothetical protein
MGRCATKLIEADRLARGKKTFAPLKFAFDCRGAADQGRPSPAETSLMWLLQMS